MSEQDEQIALIEWCGYMAKKKHPELDMIYAIPNGGLRDKVVAAKLKAEGVKSGIPDLCLPIARGSYHSLYIEMKDGIKPLSKSQKEVKPKLEAQGNAVVVCYSCDQAIEAIVMYLTLHKLPG